MAFAGAALPMRMLLVALGVGALARRRVLRRAPGPARPAAHAGRCRRRASSPTALVLSAGYQLSIAALLLGTVAATGHTLSPLAVLGAFGASQLAGAVPGPNGASPRDAALVVALVALGVPWARGGGRRRAQGRRGLAARPGARRGQPAC